MFHLSFQDRIFFLLLTFSLFVLFFFLTNHTNKSTLECNFFDFHSFCSSQQQFDGLVLDAEYLDMPHFGEHLMFFLIDLANKLHDNHKEFILVIPVCFSNTLVPLSEFLFIRLSYKVS
jgi:hypothetical protein